MRDIELIVVHCAASKPSMDIGATTIRQWHMDRGWSDIGYHKVIRRDGAVEPGRDIRVPGAHAKGFNHNSVGIVLAGGMAEDGTDDCNFTARQYASLAAVIMELVNQFPGARVVGHRDLPGVTKGCPMFDVDSFIGGA